MDDYYDYTAWFWEHDEHSNSIDCDQMDTKSSET